MTDLWPGERVHRVFTRWVLSGVQLLLMVLVGLGLLDLFYLLARRVGDKLAAIDSVEGLQYAMQHGFAGILLILIGLELLIAADIIKSVVLDPTLESMLVLGGIVVIRTFLSISLDVEINGHWPWETTRLSRESDRDTGGSQ